MNNNSANLNKVKLNTIEVSLLNYIIIILKKMIYIKY